MCSDCHGVTPNNNVSKIWNASGTRNNQGSPSTIRSATSTQRDMFEFADWSDSDMDDLAAYVNAVRYGKTIAPPALTNEECLFAWAESQLPAAFQAPAFQRGSISTLNYRLYSVAGQTNALGYNTADAVVWVLAPSFGFPAAAALDGATSASLVGSARAAGCK